MLRQDRFLSSRWKRIQALVWTCLCVGNSAVAWAQYPPWIDDTPKAKAPYGPPWVGREVKPNAPYYPPWIGRPGDTDGDAPYGPPWIGSKCHQPELPRSGEWVYPLDWRDVDWSQADSGRELHMKTQALSLKIDSKLRGNRPVEPRRVYLEYYREPSPTGPGRIVK